MTKVKIDIELKNRKNITLFEARLGKSPITIRKDKWSGELNPGNYILRYTAVGEDKGSVNIVVSQGDEVLTQKKAETTLSHPSWSGRMKFEAKA